MENTQKEYFGEMKNDKYRNEKKKELTSMDNVQIRSPKNKNNI